MKRIAPVLLLSLLLSLLLTLSACGGDSGEPGPTDDDIGETSAAVDFSDENTDFLRLNTGTFGTAQDSSMAIVDLDGGKALKLSAPSGDDLRVGFSIDSLVGSRAGDVAFVVVDVYTEHPDGQFYVVAGKLIAYRGDLFTSTVGDWQVYLDTRNPHESKLELPDNERFASGGPNMLEFAITSHYKKKADEATATVYLKSVTFLDSDEKSIPVSTSGGWTGLEEYGAPSITAVVDLDSYELDSNVAGRYCFPIAHLVGPASILNITYESNSDNSPAIIVKSEKHGWWAQTQLDIGDDQLKVEYFVKGEPVDEVGEDVDPEDVIYRFTVTLPASVVEDEYPGAFADAALAADSLSQERGVVITNWKADFVIESFTIDGALALTVPVVKGQSSYDIGKLVGSNSRIEVIYSPVPGEKLAESADDALTVTVGDSAKDVDIDGFSETQYKAVFYGFDSSDAVVFSCGIDTMTIDYITIYNPAH